MSDWRVRQRYGFGAARVTLSAPSHRPSEHPPSLMGGLGGVLAEWQQLGPGAVARRIGGVLTTMAMFALALVSLLSAMSTANLDDSEIQIVAFTEAPPEPEPVETIPGPLAEIPPPVPVEPPPVADPEPPPPPKVAKIEPPPAIAPIAEPPPVVKPARRERPEPKPSKPKPRIQIDTLAMAPEIPEAAPERERVRPRNEPRPKPRPVVALDPLSAPDAPQRVAETPRRERIARQSPKPRSRPRLEAMAAPELAAPEPSPERFALARTRVPKERARVRSTPNLAVPAPAAPGPISDGSAPARQARSRVAKPTRPSGHSMSAQALALPGGGASIPDPSPTPSVPGRQQVRTARSASDDSRRRRTKGNSLKGVPLGSLAACISDRREDQLKQRVIAAVTAREECVSGAGRYRFLETRNLNAFLMYVERSGTRQVGDRCAELQLALDCLRGQGAKETSRR